MEETIVRIEELDEIIDWWEGVLDVNGNMIYASPKLTEKFKKAGWDGGRSYCCKVQLVKLTDDLSEYKKEDRQTAWFAKSDNNGTCYLGFIEDGESVRSSLSENDSGYDMKVKPVFYHGIKFRSKTEARWAVIFDVLEIKWIYEPERFIGLNGIDYDPDFYLPDFNVYVEVKGATKQLFKSQKRISAAIDFEATPVGKSNGLLLLGPPPYSEVDKTGFAIQGNYLHWTKGVGLSDFCIFSPREYWVKPLWLEDGAYDLGDFYVGPQIPEMSSVECRLVKFPDSTSERLYEALRYARSARFDFDDNLKKMAYEGRNIIGGN